MPIVTIPKKIMSMYDPVEPGFYSFIIGKLKEEPSKDKASTNWSFDFEIASGNDGKFNEHVVLMTFNSKDFGLAQLGKFVEAVLGINILELEQDSAEVDLDKLSGKVVDGEIFHETYNGQIKNRIRNFALAGKLTAAPVPFG